MQNVQYSFTVINGKITIIDALQTSSNMSQIQLYLMQFTFKQL